MVEAQKVHLDDRLYPGRLRDLAGMPEWLWIQGTASLNPERSVAIVGTRSPFYKATEIAEVIARVAAKSGYTVISGYATGIDTAAHWGAMDAEKPTIAVLGSGILRKEPRKPALERYVLSNGLFVSELNNIHAHRSREHLMARDRITSGLADIVIVVEVSMPSGTAHTAELANDQGRQVYAIQWSQNRKYRDSARPGTEQLAEAGIAQPLPVLDADTDFERQLNTILVAAH